MQSLGQYVVSLTAAALMGSILLSLVPEGTMQALLSLVWGVLLVLGALAPLKRLSVPDLDMVLTEHWQAGLQLAAEGEDMAAQQQHRIIKQGLEAYILDKAAAMACQLSVDIQLNAQGYPAAIAIAGSVSARQQQQLAAMITNDLGIPEEDQQWIGESGGN